MSDKLFTSAGITTHSREDVTVTKVRFGTDHIRMIKTLSSSKKIGVSYNFGGRDDGYLDPVRVDVIELPQAMTKQQATQFLLTHADFQSALDQALLQESLGAREPRAPRVKKERVVKAKAAKAPISLDSIKSRAKKQVSAEQLLKELASEQV